MNDTKSTLVDPSRPIQGSQKGQTESFQDAHMMDKKIPKGLVMKYQGQWYILKAGLEWKAQQLYPGYSLSIEIVEKSPDYCLAKATFTSQTGITFNNFGDASKANVSNYKMHPYLLHLAITRAECRVLRMATAAGYSSYEEVLEGNINGQKELPKGEHDEEPATQIQIDTLKKLGVKPVEHDLTQGEAKKMIADKLNTKV